MSQTQQILKHLRHDPIGPLGALKRFGVLRLSGRILELRQAGHKIKTEMVTTMKGKRVAKYTLCK